MVTGTGIFICSAGYAPNVLVETIIIYIFLGKVAFDLQNYPKNTGTWIFITEIVITKAK